MNDTRLEISIDEQLLRVIRNGETVHAFPISSAARGVGCVEGSLRTPTGRFRIAEKIGNGEPPGTIFVGRKPNGIWQPGDTTEGDLILTRILWLDGLDADNGNTFARFIYIHGTNQEHLLGTPASHGCIRMSNTDVIKLFGLVETGTLVGIHPAFAENSQSGTPTKE